MSAKIGPKDEAVLINAVRQRRCLYDKADLHYREAFAKQQAWEEIASDVGLAVGDAKQTWCSLRNCFANVIKRRMKKPTHIFQKWKHEDDMLFLAPHMYSLTSQLSVLGDRVQFVEDGYESNDMSGHQNDTSKLGSSNGDHDNSRYEENLMFEENILNNEHDDIRDNTHLKTKYNKRKKRLITSVPNSYSEFDGSELFYLSMAKITKTLPKSEQAKLRVEISEIISKAEMQSDESGVE